jgi:hypothetical protein
MRRRLQAALAGLGEDLSSLLLWWAADDDDDLTDPATWRRASPHWTVERHAMIEGKLERALRGEADPDADDPDPVEGFKAQYLNLWPPANAPRTAVGDPVITVGEWAELVVDDGPPPATVAAVESWFSQGVAIAYASPVDGRVCLSVESFPTVESAAGAIPTPSSDRPGREVDRRRPGVAGATGEAGRVDIRGSRLPDSGDWSTPT